MNIGRVFTASVFAFFLFFFAVYSSVSLKQYYAHQTRGDLTAFAQGMWNTLQGNFMASTYNYSVHNFYDQEFRVIDETNSNVFGVHFNPIMLIFLPLYAWFPNPATLLVIQSFAVAAGGLIVYLLSLRRLNSRLLALVFAGSYWLYFPVVNSVLSEFHAYTLAIPLGLLLIYVTNSAGWLYWTVLITYLSVQENTPMIASIYGLYLLFNKETRSRGLRTFLISALYFFFVVSYLIPMLNPKGHYIFSGIYGSPLGGSIGAIALNSVLHPVLFFQTLLSSDNLTYLRDLLLPVLPFVLMSPLTLLIGIMALGQNLLSSSTHLKLHILHYESGFIPLAYSAAISGLAAIRLNKLVALTVITIMSFVGYRLFTSHRLNPTLMQTNLYTTFNQNADELLVLIPPTASVSTQDYLSGHLASRARLYQFPVYADHADYLLLTKTDRVWPLTLSIQNDVLTKLRKSHDLISENESFLLLRRHRD